MDVGGWLRGLGLEQYEAAFRDNKINERVLPSLTAEDLKELGVTALGHRRILLDAIAALRADTGGKAPSADVAPSGTDRAERRQVTVMFSDLVGSTALSARMDPEDLREVISAYQKCVAQTVQGFGGFVAKYMGVSRLQDQADYMKKLAEMRRPCRGHEVPDGVRTAILVSVLRRSLVGVRSSTNAVPVGKLRVPLRSSLVRQRVASGQKNWR